MTKLNIGFWTFEDFIQRVEAKVWRRMLLEGEDTLIKMGKLRKVKARNLGLGVYEIYLEPLEKGGRE